MGTRYLTTVIVDNKPHVAQYGQWDGYPDCAGVYIVDFLKNLIADNKIEEFKEKARDCKFISDEALDKKYKGLGIDASSGLLLFEDANKFKEKYPALDRDLGCEVLGYIMEEGPCELINNFDFIENALFCEWAYLIDFDNECLEVYGGYGPEYKTSVRFPEMSCYPLSFAEIKSLKTDTIVKRAKRTFD